MFNLIDVSPAAALTVALVRAHRTRRYNKMIAASQAKLAETTLVTSSQVTA